MNVEVVEMFPGGGTMLAALTEGLRQGGATVSVVGLIELEKRYLAISSKAHPEASTWHGSAAEWHPAELSAPRKAVRLFSAGIPCLGASRSGISKNGLEYPEEHPKVGALFLNVLQYIRLHSPDWIVLECVDSYKNTLSVRCIRDALRATGYTFDERVVNPLKEFGTPSQRKRWILVATRETAFCWLYEALAFNGTLDDYLDPESPEDEAESATAAQVAAADRYCARKAAEGCRFRRTIIDRTSTKCPTFPKTLGKRQHTGTYVKTSTSYRMPRPREIARLHGFKKELFAGLSKTLQYELYGQGVVAGPFISLGECIARCIRGERTAAPTTQLQLFA